MFGNFGLVLLIPSMLGKFITLVLFFGYSYWLCRATGVRLGYWEWMYLSWLPLVYIYILNAPAESLTRLILVSIYSSLGLLYSAVQLFLR